MPDDSIRQAVTDRVKLTEIISTPKPDIATMRNILENPSVGLLLMLPGVEEVVRINGKATLTEEPTLLADSAVNGSTPALGVIVKIDDVFFHCAKAVIRSKLWDPKTPIQRSEFPTYGEIVRDQRAPDAADAAAAAAAAAAADINADLQNDYKTRLY